MTFADCIPLLVANKRVKRECYDNFHLFIGEDNDCVWKYLDLTLLDGGPFIPDRDDLTATDWEVTDNEYPQRNM